MTVQAIEESFREKVSREISLIPEGVGRYRVLTPFTFDDGDHLVILLKSETGRWLITDEGHTFMRLTYEIDETNLKKGKRQTVISDALSLYNVDDRDGEFAIQVHGDNFGDSLFSFIQAILRISDVALLTREFVKSTFMEDLFSFLSETVPESRRQFDWHDEKHDPDAKYTVDCRINGSPKPLLIFGLPNDDKVQVVTITLLQIEKWGTKARSLGIFEDQEAISRKVLARFSDVGDKQFSSLAVNKDKIAAYLGEAL